MSEMSHHHVMAVMMAAPVLMGGYHGDLFTLPENVVISQGQEIRQMDEWLQTWYGLERPLDPMAMPMNMPMPTPMNVPAPTPKPNDDMGH